MSNQKNNERPEETLFRALGQTSGELLDQADAEELRARQEAVRRSHWRSWLWKGALAACACLAVAAVARSVLTIQGLETASGETVGGAQELPASAVSQPQEASAPSAAPSPAAASPAASEEVQDQPEAAASSAPRQEGGTASSAASEAPAQQEVRSASSAPAQAEAAVSEWLNAEMNSAAALLGAPEYPQALSAREYEAYQTRLEENEVEEEFRQSMARFACQSTGQLLNGQENAAYSPISLYYALSMAGLGAEGETQSQLLAALGAEDTRSLAAQAGRLYRCLYQDNEEGTLKLANSLWLTPNGGFRRSYVEAAVQQLYASVYAADFTDPALKEQMGRWVSENTGGLVSEPPEFEADTQAMLLNTVYYAGQWQMPFLAENNTQGVFHAPEGDVTAEYMNCSTGGSFARGEGYLRATLGLSNGAMTFVLPDEGTSAEELLASPERLAQILDLNGEDHYGQITWQLPKFDFAAQYDLIGMLQALGVTDAFDGQKADFSGLCEQPLYVSSVSQQSRISVNEYGVSAAACTSIGMARTSLPVETAEMILDRPFLYVLSAQDGTTLFVGVCSNPAAE